MSRPKLLDLFCGAGGAAVGYYRAGFDVVGVDIKPQPRYPFEFIQADAMTFMDRMLKGDNAYGSPGGGALTMAGDSFSYPRLYLREFAAIHASPPCQRFSTMTRKWGREECHPDYIEELRLLLVENFNVHGAPYVIENVPGAPLYQAVTLCGSMFGLGDNGNHLRRHRLFESNVWFFPPAPCAHVGRAVQVYGHAGGSSKRDHITFASTAIRNRAMGIDWMKGDELSEAIPPAYTAYIGSQLMAVLS